MRKSWSSDTSILWDKYGEGKYVEGKGKKYPKCSFFVSLESLLKRTASFLVRFVVWAVDFVIAPAQNRDACWICTSKLSVRAETIFARSKNWNARRQSSNEETNQARDFFSFHIHTPGKSVNEQHFSRGNKKKISCFLVRDCDKCALQSHYWCSMLMLTLNRVLEHLYFGMVCVCLCPVV